MNEIYVSPAPKHQWSLYKMLQKDEAHVVPLNDIREHELEKTCWCHPTEDPEYPGMYMHHSADGREAFERGTRQPS